MMDEVERWNRFAAKRRAAARAEGDYWQSRARAYSDRVESRWADVYDSTRTLLSERLAKLHDASVLDIGAGTGQWALFFAARCTAVTALEPSAGMRTVLNENIAASSHGTATKITVIDGRWPEYDTGVHDISFCSNAMYEWDDLKSAVNALQLRTRREIYLVLRAPGLSDVGARIGAMACPEDPVSGTDFQLLYRALLRLGVYANVTFETRATHHVRQFDSLADAVGTLTERFDGAVDSAHVAALLRDEGCVGTDGRVMIPTRGKSACVWWTVD